MIRLADGEYRFDQRLEASASGTAAAPITLVGSRAAVIRTKNASGDYGLHITGDHWRIEGITVAHATKGIVLDGSVGTVIDGVEVFDIGDEGVHFRVVLERRHVANSFIHDTGRNSPQYGEGVYVGSANSNWHDVRVHRRRRGRSARATTPSASLIEANVFEDITAEGADLKEGTDSGVLRGNTFRRVGASGKNSADSAVDAKGNGWIDRGQRRERDRRAVGRRRRGATERVRRRLPDPSVYDGYGTGQRVPRQRRRRRRSPGSASASTRRCGNVVTCDNQAPGAALGLVGDNGQASACVTDVR